jgi:hypothetical protein
MLAGNYAAALRLLRRAVAGLIDPTNPVTAYANFNLGQTLVRLGDCGAALPFLERAEQLEPTRAVVGAAIAYAQQCAATQPGRRSDTAEPAAGREPIGGSRLLRPGRRPSRPRKRQRQRQRIRLRQRQRRRQRQRLSGHDRSPSRPPLPGTRAGRARSGARLT